MDQADLDLGDRRVGQGGVRGHLDQKETLVLEEDLDHLDLKAVRGLKVAQGLKDVQVQEDVQGHLVLLDPQDP